MVEEAARGAESDGQGGVGEGAALALRATGTDLVRTLGREKAAEVLYKRYAGFLDAGDLTPGEKLVAVASLVPAYAEVEREARDTIERLNDENARIAAALELHLECFRIGRPWCMTCRREWPCRTYSILTGDTPA